MKTWTPTIALFLSTFAIVVECTPLYAQGSLTPPTGAPAPTMKSLDVVEARIPLTSTSGSRIDITKPGSYYLTGNLTVSRNGIYISANNVTLDLNGFLIHGIESSSTTYGVKVFKSGEDLQNVVVQNGSIDGFNYGVYFDGVSNGSICRMRISNSQTTGLTLYSKSGHYCSNNLISLCSVDSSDADGISLFALGTTNGNQVELCSVRQSGGRGVSVRAYTEGVVRGNTVTLCNISESGTEGVNFYTNSGPINESNVITRCAVYDSTSSGINVSYGKGVVVRSNTVGKAQESGIYFSGGYGNQIVRNTIRSTQNSGVSAGSTSASLVENNHVSDVTSASTSYGFKVINGTKPSIIRKNSSVGCNNNFTYTSNNAMGPENQVIGAIGAADSRYGAPWTNFSINQTP